MKKPVKIPPATLEWLLGGEDWVRHSTLRAVPGLAASAEELEEARRVSVASPLVKGLVAELASWPGTPLASHKSPQQLFHRLSLAAELGLRREDRGAKAIAAKVMGSPSPEGPFTLGMNIGAAHGGSGQDTMAWALCDAPVTMRALARMGFSQDPAFKKALDHLVGLRTLAERGWPCATSPNLGFRGPGRKSDPCPYATLAMLELLLELPDRREGPDARAAADCLLDLWERSREEHPYIFYMGTDFRKLKAPLFWYDILSVLDTLSRFPAARKDPRFGDMLSIATAKRTGGGFVPESVYLDWKAWDFGQKKAPSPWIAWYIERIERRLSH